MLHTFIIKYETHKYSLLMLRNRKKFVYKLGPRELLILFLSQVLLCYHFCPAPAWKGEMVSLQLSCPGLLTW